MLFYWIVGIAYGNGVRGWRPISFSGQPYYNFQSILLKVVETRDMKKSETFNNEISVKETQPNRQSDIHKREMWMKMKQKRPGDIVLL